EGDAWSGGDAWRSPEIVSELTRFVHEGGSLIGVAEPTAAPGGDTRFALAHVLGVDEDRGEYACHQPWAFDAEDRAPFMIADGALHRTAGIRLTDPDTTVLRAEGVTPVLTLRRFGKGSAVYMGGFTYSPEAARMLLEMLLYLTGADGKIAGLTDDPLVECAFYPAAGALAVMNSADEDKSVTVSLPSGPVRVGLRPLETLFLEVPSGQA
ncbi:MAG: D-galactosyl-beta-1-4-L-rhamnose phosphorylase, partial [Clostridia bacterium]|nr:D-galactosyl-beta-1-4-L-rhamnose phosphorylase [Clostridia bacterium]